MDRRAARVRREQLGQEVRTHDRRTVFVELSPKIERASAHRLGDRRQVHALHRPRAVRVEAIAILRQGYRRVEARTEQVAEDLPEVSEVREADVQELVVRLRQEHGLRRLDRGVEEHVAVVLELNERKIMDRAVDDLKVRRAAVARLARDVVHRETALLCGSEIHRELGARDLVHGDALGELLRDLLRAVRE